MKSIFQVFIVIITIIVCIDIFNNNDKFFENANKPTSSNRNYTNVPNNNRISNIPGHISNIPDTEFPPCGDKEVKNAVIEAVNDSPAAITRGLRAKQVLEAEDAFQIEVIPYSGMRICDGTLLTNAGEMYILITLKWSDEETRKWYLTVKSNSN